MKDYQSQNVLMIGLYYDPTNLDRSFFNLHVLLDKFDFMFDSTVFSEEETPDPVFGSEESFWMGRIAGFVGNYVGVDDRQLVNRLLQILQTKYSLEWIRQMLVHRPF